MILLKVYVGLILSMTVVPSLTECVEAKRIIERELFELQKITHSDKKAIKVSCEPL